MNSRLLVILPLLVVALLLTAGPARADTVLAREQAPGTVSAYQGRLAWSGYDPASGNYRLETRWRGVNSLLPIAPRRVPFDVDLGPDPDGNMVAVYSRCDREPTRTWGFGLPLWTSASGCDLYQYDFGDNGERQIMSRDRSSEFLPSVWKGRIAFARRFERRAGNRGRQAYLYITNADGSHPRRQPNGPRGHVEAGLPSPTALDLAGSKLAFALAWQPSGGRATRYDVRLDGMGSQLLVDGNSAGAAGIFHSAALDRGRLYYAQAGAPGDGSVGGGLYHRYRISMGAWQQAVAPSNLFSLSVSAGRAYYGQALSDPGDVSCLGRPPTSESHDCRIALAAPIAFRDQAAR